MTDEKTIEQEATPESGAVIAATDADPGADVPGAEVPGAEVPGAEVRGADGDDAAGADADGAVADPEAKESKRKVVRTVVASVLTTLVVLGLGAWVGLLIWNHHQTDLADQARTTATEVAKKQAEAMFSYDYGNVEKQMAAASNGLTGDFKTQFEKLVKDQVVPAAKDKQMTVKASVIGQAPISTTADSASVLLFVNQVANGNTGPNASFTPSRVKVDLVKSGDHWLVDGLTTI